MDKKYTSVHYHSYLQLEKLLDAQKLRSEEVGQPAHDEMLFIVVHQVYELWFKQIIHELKSVIDMFRADDVDERNISTAVHRLQRINEIQNLIIQQITTMETLTPLDFLDFRHFLFPASGFQSFQFRIIEIMLGLRETERLKYNKHSFNIVFDDEKKQYLKDLERDYSLLEVIEDWLERTPFIKVGSFNFLEEYKKSVNRMVQKEKEAIEASQILSDQTKAQRLRMIGDTDTYFANVLDPDHHQKMIDEGQLKLSYKATIAALLIHLYRDEPILQLPFQLLDTILSIEQRFTNWRSRHAQMVLRMIGRKSGTGGSSGHRYLNETAKKHQIFGDLFNISTLLIPRSELPILPEEVKQKLGFYYST